eukprot:1519713-Lingulodinium_polyedra.AAC.1
MYVVGEILARDSLQMDVRTRTVLCNPLYNAHSQHAADVRAPDKALAYYLDQSRAKFLEPLNHILAL